MLFQGGSRLQGQDFASEGSKPPSPSAAMVRKRVQNVSGAARANKNSQIVRKPAYELEASWKLKQGQFLFKLNEHV